MRCPRAANWTIAMAVALGAVAAVQADGPPRPLRPQPKFIVYQPPADSPVTVAVMGQVALPGTYQFPQAPALAEVVQAAKGLKPDASPMVRIVRGHRLAQRVSLTTAATEKLFSGDLVIVDTQPIRDHSPGASELRHDVENRLRAIQHALLRRFPVGHDKNRVKVARVVPERHEHAAGQLPLQLSELFFRCVLRAGDNQTVDSSEFLQPPLRFFNFPFQLLLRINQPFACSLIRRYAFFIVLGNIFLRQRVRESCGRMRMERSALNQQNSTVPG